MYARSETFEVMSSSVVEPSCGTDGLMQTGGTGKYCHINISGLPSAGFMPKSSQSEELTFLNIFRIRNGLRSSTAFLMFLSMASFPRLASAKDLSNSSFAGGGVFFIAFEISNLLNCS